MSDLSSTEDYMPTPVRVLDKTSWRSRHHVASICRGGIGGSGGGGGVEEEKEIGEVRAESVTRVTKTFITVVQTMAN